MSLVTSGLRGSVKEDAPEGHQTIPKSRLALAAGLGETAASLAPAPEAQEVE